MDLRSAPTALSVLAVIFAIASTGEALQCHQCTSYEHAKCADPFTYLDGEERKLKTNEFLKDCPTDREYTLCRKVYQNVRGDERVIRSCGYEEYKNDCYKTVLEEYNTYVCTCKEDGCNGSSTIQVSMISVLMAGILAALFK